MNWSACVGKYLPSTDGIIDFNDSVALGDNPIFLVVPFLVSRTIAVEFFKSTSFRLSDISSPRLIPDSRPTMTKAFIQYIFDLGAWSKSSRSISGESLSSENSGSFNLLILTTGFTQLISHSVFAVLNTTDIKVRYLFIVEAFIVFANSFLNLTILLLLIRANEYCAILKVCNLLIL